MDKRFERRYLRFKRGKRDIKYLIRVWVLYLYYKLFRRNKRPEKYWYSDFKENDNYYKIVGNDKYYFKRNYYFMNNNWNKLVERPYRFFQPFSDREKNYYFREKCSPVSCFFERDKGRLIVSKVKDKVYYEGITFQKMDFFNISLNDVAFHNCIFESCRFVNLITEAGFDSNCKELFSACEFNRTEFEDAKFNDTVFSMCTFRDASFTNSVFNNCTFHKVRFLKVKLSKNIIMSNTSIFSPYRRFHIFLELPDAKVVIDPRCKVTKTEDYIDSIENIEEFFDSKRKTFRTMDYKLTKNTYQIIEWIYAENSIPWESNMYANPYYQKKYAETRSHNQKLQRITGYISEKVIGYGEKPLNTLVTIAITVFIYGCIYMFSGYCIDETIYNFKVLEITGVGTLQTIISYFSKSLYFSFITLVTVGLGDIKPFGWMSQLLMGTELCLGAILMTLFTSLLFRKMTR